MPGALESSVRMVCQWREQGQRKHVCFVNVHSVATAQSDPILRAALNGAGLAATDGRPLVWWSRMAGFSGADQVCGYDFMEALCAASISKGYRHYFYGGKPEVVEKLARELTRLHPGLIVAGYRSPPFRPLSAEEDDAEIAAINEARPDFVWVGLGMPKQEKWMAAHVGRVNATALLGVGAAFDFYAGSLPRAPRWMQRAGLEWLFRLACEPRRLAHRYFVYNSIFLIRAFQQATGLKTFEADWTPSADNAKRIEP